MGAPFTRDEVATRVRALIIEHLLGGAPSDHVGPETDLYDELAADSLDQVELAMAIEVEFDIELSDDAIAGAGTVGQLTEAVIKALAAAGRPVAGEAA